MGIGVIVIVEFTGVPIQPPEVGVKVYVTEPLLAPVVVNVWLIVAPLPFDAPAAPDWLTVQLNVVLPNVELKLSDVLSPEQIVLSPVTVTTGASLIVMLVWKFVAQVPAVGEKVYCVIPGVAVLMEVGDQVPEMLLIESAGNAEATAP